MKRVLLLATAPAAEDAFARVDIVRILSAAPNGGRYHALFKSLRDMDQKIAMKAMRVRARLVLARRTGTQISITVSGERAGGR